MMSMRTVEAMTTGAMSMYLAQAAPLGATGDSGLLESIAKLSPTALVGFFLIMLWRRHTAQEDSLALLTREAIVSMTHQTGKIDELIREIRTERELRNRQTQRLEIQNGH